jgi:hypothetical protein
MHQQPPHTPSCASVTGDFDGDGADELLVAPDLDDNTATGVTFGGGPGPPTDSRGNDFWVMKVRRRRAGMDASESDRRTRDGGRPRL